MRITNNITTRNALERLQTSLRRIDDAQDRASTGRKVEIASDAPAASGSILGAGSSLRAIEQYQRNINAATARVSAEDDALNTVSRLLERAKELGIGQASASASANTRLVSKAEVDQLLQQAVQIGNQQHEGEYLFGGDQSGTLPLTTNIPPFSAAPPTGNRRAEIGSAFTVRSNHNATEIFLSSGVLDALHSLSAALGADSQPQIEAALTSLDTAHANVQVLTGETGAQAAQLEVSASNLKALDTSLRAFKSNLEDADLEAAVTELVSRQTAYQAAMLSTSRIMGMNLTEYLR